MKKISSVLFVFLALALFLSYPLHVSAMSFSISVKWDVGNDYDGDGDSLTDEITKFEANIGSWIKQSLTDPGTFTEYGVFNIDTLFPTTGSFEGFTGQAGSSYSVTGVLPEVGGKVTSYTHIPALDQFFLTYSIDSNNSPLGDLQLYLQDGHIVDDPAKDMVDYYNAGGVFGNFDGILDKYNNGTLFAGLNFVSNQGLIQYDKDIFDPANLAHPTLYPNIIGGNFNATFSFVPGNTNWLWQDKTFADWEAEGYSFFAELTATLAPNTGYTFIGGPDGQGNLNVLGDLQDGTTFAAVPEPSTIFLLGAGLLGLAAFGRRKFNKNS